MRQRDGHNRGPRSSRLPRMIVELRDRARIDPHLVWWRRERRLRALWLLPTVCRRRARRGVRNSWSGDRILGCSSAYSRTFSPSPRRNEILDDESPKSGHTDRNSATQRAEIHARSRGPATRAPSGDRILGCSSAYSRTFSPSPRRNEILDDESPKSGHTDRNSATQRAEIHARSNP